MDSREAFVALNMIDHVGPVRVRQLLEHFGDAASILKASKQQLLRVRFQQLQQYGYYGRAWAIAHHL